MDGALISIWNQSLTRWLRACFYDAAEEGRAESVQWLLSNGPRVFLYDRAFNLATNNGHIKVAELLQRTISSEHQYFRALPSASQNGYFELVQWLYQNLPRGSTFPSAVEVNAIEWSAAGGHLDIAQWIHAHRSGKDLPWYDISFAVAND